MSTVTDKANEQDFSVFFLIQKYSQNSGWHPSIGIRHRWPILRPVRVGNLGTSSLIRDCDDLSLCKTRIKF